MSTKDTARFRPNLPLLALGMIALLAGVYAGLARIGWRLPLPGWGLTASHGPLMVAGFLGTLISLERAVGLRKPWAFAAPLLTGAGGIALLLGATELVPQALITAGSVVTLLVFLYLVRLHSATFTWLMVLSAVLWLVGNLLWMAGRPIHGATPWWMGFLVVMIAGERVELTRLRRPSRLAQAPMGLAVAVFVAGLALSAFSYGPGIRVAGAGLVALTLWLVRYDIARRNVKGQGLVRYMAAGLLLGYVWLAVGGALSLAVGGQVAGPRYDAIVHSILLGFVMSMVFAHGPVILPGILRRGMEFHWRFYGHLALLHLSLALRVAGDLSGWWTGRQWGGLLNAAALALFLLNTVSSALIGARRR